MSEEGPDCAYQLKACERWTDAQQSEEADGSLTLTGTCSRCLHPTSYVSRLVYTDGAVATRAVGAPPEVVVKCDCGQPHEGRDEAGGQGCGCYWYYPEPSQP